MVATRSVGQRKRRSRLFTMLIACAAFGLLAGPAAAQQYPTRPVRIITPFAPGSGSDSVMPARRPEADGRLGPAGRR